MTGSSTLTRGRESCGCTNMARLLLCSLALVAFATLGAFAQTAVNPTTNTILFSGPGASSASTVPKGGIILQGTAISTITGQPVRHLWVADGFFGVCRMDPEIDAPGPWQINRDSCSFFNIAGGAAIPFGGQFAYDPAKKFLYFVDNIAASQGIFRIGFLPDQDGGHGLLDLNNVLTLGDGVGGRKATFLGGLGCPMGTGVQPSGAALSPLGDLWVGFADSGEIFRFNSPGTATSDGFLSCAQFVQLVATTPDNALSRGLAWIGHDLWSADGTSPFVIPNADTTCLVPPNPACSTASGTVASKLPGVGAPLTVSGDQFYPAVNGNNLYFGLTGQVAWVGNVAGGAAGQTLTTTYMNTAGISPAPDPALAAMSALTVDGTDPANLVVYSAEDPFAGVVPVVNGAARWWQTTQTSAGPAAPGTPLDVVGAPGDSQITLSWSPAQVAQPVTSYTVRNSFISAGSPLADIIVNPAPGAVFPPTALVISGLTNGVSYSFEVSASNGNRTSPFSAPSAPVAPGFLVPSAPTNVVAQAGDTQAVVTWTVSNSNGGSPITSYTVTVLSGGVATGETVTVPPPVFGSNTDSTLVGGLTNGLSYTFTVHATNVIGSSDESAPSAPVILSAANLPTVSIAMSKPNDPTATPVQLTYTITLTNTSSFPAANVSVTNTLNTLPANISSVSRDANGVVTVNITAPEAFTFGQTVTIAGVTDSSFDGTFGVVKTISNTSFTYSQAGPVAVSGSGTATLQPMANILSVQTAQATCTSGGAGVVSFSCNVANMDPGAVVRIPFIVQMQDQAITNSATMSGTDTAGTPLATATASATTNPPAPLPTGGGVSTDLQLTGKPQHGSVKVNSADAYLWVISNKGVDAPSVSFSQPIPNGAQVTSITISQGSCTGPAPGSQGGTVTCSVSTLVNAGTVNVTVNFIAKKTGDLSSTGTASFDGVDSKPGNESATIIIKGQ